MIIDVSEAANRLSQLVEAAADGEEIILINQGLAAARLVPIGIAHPERRFGGLEGWIADDFDDPLPDHIIAAFEGR